MQAPHLAHNRAPLTGRERIAYYADKLYDACDRLAKAEALDRGETDAVEATLYTLARLRNAVK